MMVRSDPNKTPSDNPHVDPDWSQEKRDPECKMGGR